MKPGDRVVCVDASQPKWSSLDIGLDEGHEYVLRWVGDVTHYVEGTYRGVKLVGVERGADPAGYCDGDLPFRASRFRPVVEPKMERELEVAE